MKSTESLFDPSPFYESNDSISRENSSVSSERGVQKEDNISNEEISCGFFEIDKQQMEDIVNLDPPLLTPDEESKESDMFSRSDYIKDDQPSLESTLTALLVVGAYEDAYACWKCLSINHAIDTLSKKKIQFVEEDKLEEAIQIRSEIKLLQDELSLYIEGTDSINEKNKQMQIEAMVTRWLELAKLLGSNIVKKVCENLTEEKSQDPSSTSVGAVGSANKKIQQKLSLYSSCNDIKILSHILRNQIQDETSNSSLDSVKKEKIVNIFEKTCRSSLVSLDILTVRERLLNETKNVSSHFRENKSDALRTIEQDINSLVTCFRSRIRKFHLCYLQLTLFPNMSCHIETLLRKLNMVVHESMSHLKHLHHIARNNSQGSKKDTNLEEASFVAEVLTTSEFQKFLLGHDNIIRVANMVVSTAIDSSLSEIGMETKSDVSNVISSISDSINQYIRILQYFDNILKVTGFALVKKTLFADLLHIESSKDISLKAAESVSTYIYGFRGDHNAKDSDQMNSISTTVEPKSILDLLMKGKDLCNITLLPLCLGRSSKEGKGTDESSEKNENEIRLDELTFVYKSGTPYFTPVLNFWVYHFLPSGNDLSLDKNGDKVDVEESEQSHLFERRGNKSKGKGITSNPKLDTKVIIQLPKAEFVID